jgi:hypothetical protein
MVQLPSEDVTTVRPFEVEVDMLLEPLPGPACVVMEGPAPVVVPDTLPPPAETDDCMPPAVDAEVFGGFWPAFRCTVLQFALGWDEFVDTLLPLELDELDELLLSAWAATTTSVRPAAHNTALFMAKSPSLG